MPDYSGKNKFPWKWNNFHSFNATDLREIPVDLVQDFHNYFRLVHKSIVSKLLPDPFEDFGKRSLTQTVHLKGRPLLQFKF